jgi:hypothetical protein
MVNNKVLYTWKLQESIPFSFVALGFELRAYALSHSTSSFFCDGFFLDRVFWTICQGWLWTWILLLSVFWVTKITGVNHQHPAEE